MICDECRVDSTYAVSSQSNHHLYCSQHPRTIEARRYALLQAAVTLWASGLPFRNPPLAACVDGAEDLLAEIEKREAARKEVGCRICVDLIERAVKRIRMDCYCGKEGKS